MEERQKELNSFPAASSRCRITSMTWCLLGDTCWWTPEQQPASSKPLVPPAAAGDLVPDSTMFLDHSAKAAMTGVA